MISMNSAKCKQYQYFANSAQCTENLNVFVEFCMGISDQPLYPGHHQRMRNQTFIQSNPVDYKKRQFSLHDPFVIWYPANM